MKLINFFSEQNLEEHEIFNADISINTYLNSIDIKTKVIISFADTFNWVVVTFIESTPVVICIQLCLRQNLMKWYMKMINTFL